MKITIDKNHLLVIENENIPQVKEYTYNVGGYMFSAFDKGMIVLHKKEWKIINLKNFGDTMSVAYICDADRGTGVAEFQLSAFEAALKVFQSFNEETGEKYFFLPTLQEKELIKKNSVLQKLGSTCELKKTDKGIVVESKDSTTEIASSGSQGFLEILNFLFGLTLVYGKFDAKNGVLASLKIQIPLFGQYLGIQEKFDEIVSFLMKNGLFMKADKLQTSNGIIYQISCKDYEVLELFAKWYEPVEKFEKISKLDFVNEMKIKLIDFIKTEKLIPEEGKVDSIAFIEKGVLKLLTK